LSGFIPLEIQAKIGGSAPFEGVLPPIGLAQVL
jgi:hypothetical protein